MEADALLGYENIPAWMEVVSQSLRQTLLFHTFPDSDGNAYTKPHWKLKQQHVVAYDFFTASRHVAADANEGDAASNNVIGAAYHGKAGGTSLFTTVSGTVGSLQADTNMLALVDYASEVEHGVGVGYDGSGGTTTTDNIMPGIWHLPLEIDGSGSYNRGDIIFGDRSITSTNYALNPSGDMTIDENTGFLWVISQSASSVHIIHPDDMTNEATVSSLDTSITHIDYQPAFVYLDVGVGAPGFADARMWLSHGAPPGTSGGYIGWVVETDGLSASTVGSSGSLTWQPGQVLVDRQAFGADFPLVGAVPYTVFGGTGGLGTIWERAFTSDLSFDSPGIFRTGLVSDWVFTDGYFLAIDSNGWLYRLDTADNDYAVLASKKPFGTNFFRNFAWDTVEEALYVNDAQTLYKLNPNDFSEIWSIDHGLATYAVPAYHQGYDQLWFIQRTTPAKVLNINKDDGSINFTLTMDFSIPNMAKFLAYPYAPYLFVSESTGGVYQVYVGT